MSDSKTAEVEFYLMIDEAGDFVVSRVDDDLNDKWDEEFAAREGATRVFTFKMHLPLPKPTVVSATVPDTDETVTVTVQS